MSLSRDTTETDLKQRREIKSGTAFYIDQVCLSVKHWLRQEIGSAFDVNNHSYSDFC